MDPSAERHQLQLLGALGHYDHYEFAAGKSTGASVFDIPRASHGLASHSAHSDTVRELVSKNSPPTLQANSFEVQLSIMQNRHHSPPLHLGRHFSKGQGPSLCAAGDNPAR